MNDPAAHFWQMRSFSLAHRRGGDWLLHKVDLSVPRGGLYLLLGESGGGKSSLMRLSAGLLEEREPAPHTEGEFTCLGECVRGGLSPNLRGRVTAVLQDEGLLDELTPLENVQLALRTAGRSRKLAPALLAQAGLDPAPAQTAALSGGQRKRLAVARALAGDPEVLFCDEPTAGLDPEAARAIAQLLRETQLRKAGMTMVVITHDAPAFAGLMDGVLVLDREQRSLRFATDAPTITTSGTLRAPGRPSEVDEVVHGLKRHLLQWSSIGEVLLQSILRLPPLEVQQTLRSILQCTLTPLPFVAVGSAVIGGLATFFALRNNPVQGAFERDLLAGTGKVLLAVLVPLLAGFFFTARVAAGATARLGTMKRTQQISALAMIGIRPMDYLLTPLVWGMVLALPVVTILGCIAASLGALVAAEAAAGIHGESWAAAFFRNLDATDVRIVVAKACLSGYLVALTCYHLGVGPKRSGADVGDAVNRAIVVGMGMVLAVHAIFTLFVYA